MSEQEHWNMPPEVHLCNAVALLWQAGNHLSFVDEDLEKEVGELLRRVNERSIELLQAKTTADVDPFLPKIR